MIIIKRLLVLVTVICILCSLFCVNGFADSGKFAIGDYFIIGQYNEAPILWRYVADDDNGMLIVSDKIICFKIFGKYSDRDTSIDNVFWKESHIRTWLNSSALSGQVISFDGVSIYNGEAGFLSDGNFTQAERNLMKSVTQWTMLPYDKLELSENALAKKYNYIKTEAHGYGIGFDKPAFPGEQWDISEKCRSKVATGKPWA